MPGLFVFIGDVTLRSYRPPLFPVIKGIEALRAEGDIDGNGKTDRHIGVPLDGSAAGGAQSAESRTYLDNLDQSSPAAVAEEFTAAMAADDYFGAYYLLSPEAKEGSFQAVAAMQTARLLPGADPFNLTGSVFADEAVPHVMLDDLADQSQVFDDMMTAGQTAGLLPFSFEGAKLGDVAETPEGATAKVAVVGEPAELELHLTKTEDGAWRVDTIAWPGSVDGKPWSAAEDAPTMSARPLHPAPRIYLDGFDIDTPEKAVTAFIEAFAGQDYFRSYLLLTPAAKRGPFDPMQPMQMPIFLPGIDMADLPGTGLFRNIERADQLAFDTMHDPAVIFDRLLVAARRQGALPFDLMGATIAEVGPIKEAGAGQEMAQVTVRVAAKSAPEDLTFQLMQLPNGQWRVDQISWPGSLDWARPWGGEYQAAPVN